MASLKFSIITELFELLEQLQTRLSPAPKSEKDRSKRNAVESWFRKHQESLNPYRVNLAAVLSTLLPHRRPDRVYRIQQETLGKCLPRCLNLGSADVKSLESCKRPGNGDLGAALQRVLALVDAPPRPGVLTVDEVDSALTEIASVQPFSSRSIQLLAPERSRRRQRHVILGPLFKKAYSKDAKWLVRLILRDLSPVLLDDYLILKGFHFLLPGLIMFQDDLLEATRFLTGTLKDIPASPNGQERDDIMLRVRQQLRPVLGVKVGRPNFHKARSIKHCMRMTRGQNWFAERKYDGEYCEIHIDLASKDPIQIFSKSGKDSTKDRWKLHSTIRRSLRLDTEHCAFKRRCIVLGEMVVYDDKEKKTAEFHKIRKHVTRSGISIGNDANSQCHPWEHLMIVYFDVLLRDDEQTLNLPYDERQRSLLELCTPEEGRARLAEGTMIDFSRSYADECLLRHFAAARYHGHEGLVLKPASSPYLSFGHSARSDARSTRSPGYFIKVKADYMPELGGSRDVADFAVIGARYDPQQAQKTSVQNLQWTDFYLGCLMNCEAVLQCGHIPRYRVVDVISQDQCIPDAILQALNAHGRFVAGQYTPETQIDDIPPFEIIFGSKSQLPMLSHYFREPMVVEVLGSEYDIMSNDDIYMLRHARILKHHLDRTWKDTVTLDELQAMAEESRTLPIPSQQEIDQTSQRLRKCIEQHGIKMSQENKSTLQTTQESTPRSTGSALSSPATTRSRRSPGTGRSQPVLVHIDTFDRIQPNEAFAPSCPIPAKPRPQTDCAINLPKNITSPLQEMDAQILASALNTACNAHPSFQGSTTRNSIPTPPSSKEAVQQAKEVPECPENGTVPIPRRPSDLKQSPDVRLSHSPQKKRPRVHPFRGNFKPVSVKTWLNTITADQTDGSLLSPPKRRKYCLPLGDRSSRPETPTFVATDTETFRGSAVHLLRENSMSHLKSSVSRPPLTKTTSMPEHAKEDERVELRRAVSYHLEMGIKALRKLEAIERNSIT